MAAGIETFKVPQMSNVETTRDGVWESLAAESMQENSSGLSYEDMRVKDEDYKSKKEVSPEAIEKIKQMKLKRQGGVLLRLAQNL